MVLVFLDDVGFSIGLAVVLLFTVAIGLIAFGSAIAACSSRFENDLRRHCAVAALCTTILAFGLFLHAKSHLYEFSRVSIEEDGTWNLINPFGLTVATIPPDIRRTVTLYQERQEPIIPRYRPKIQSWVRIELSDGETFESVKSTQNSVAVNADFLKTLGRTLSRWD